MLPDAHPLSALPRIDLRQTVGEHLLVLRDYLAAHIAARSTKHTLVVA